MGGCHTVGVRPVLQERPVLEPTTPSALERILTDLRGRGVPLDLAEVARTLVSAARSPAAPIARRIVAAALGRPAAELPERLAPEELCVASSPPTWTTTPLERAEFHVVDLETTGLSRGCDILEIGAVHVAAGRRVSQFFTLVRPVDGRVPAKITALTGIDDALVREAPPQGECLRRFRAWLDRAPSAVFVAHNAPFDSGFLNRGFARYGLRPLSAPVVCTRKLARRALPELPRYDLDRLCGHFGIENGARHRATGDASATADLLQALLGRLAGQGGLGTLGALLDRLHRPPPPRPGRRRRTVRRSP